MQRQRFGRGGEPAVDMADLLVGAQPLLVVIEQVEGRGDGVAEMQFLDVADMHFRRVDRHPALFRIGRPEAHHLKGLVGSAVEQHVVIGHVEMAVIIDPVLLDLHGT
jgi:hypothetical protein